MLLSDPAITTPRLPQEYNLVHIVKRRNGEKMLAKGRKDVNEAIADAAARESFEETGYKNAIIELPIPSLAPGARDIPNNKEAIGMTLNVDSYCRREENIKVQKFVFWFVSEVLLDAEGKPVQRVEGTQLAYEDYEVQEMSLEDSLAPGGISNSAHRQMVELTKSLLLKRSEMAIAKT
jgi:8-oxo-dGTP pyrophosphatase MutT (NUDIX family)